MGYSSTEVLKRFVKSDGTKCSKLSDIYGHLNTRTYRAPLNINDVNLSNGQNIIDVIAIGFDASWLRSKQYDPIVMSLDTLSLANLNLKADITFAETNPKYYSNAQPLYKNYNSNLFLPGILAKTSDITKCNKYITADKSIPFCGAHANNRVTMKPYDYWSDNEKNISNYSRDAVNQDKNGVCELHMLFYTTDIIDQLQTRFGYRMANNLDPYHWSNWLILSASATVDTGSRYFKLMYLTEFDYYMHAGVIANPSLLDAYLCKSIEFNSMLKTIISPYNGVMNVKDAQHFNSNFLSNGSTLAAGQFIYSKDYKYKLHLTHNGNLNVYEFPIYNDDITICKTKAIVSPSFVANADNHLTCYLAIQTDGNIAIYYNPATSMQNDPQYYSTLNSYTPTNGFNGTRNTAIVILGGYVTRNKLTSPLQSMTDAQLYQAMVNKNPLNVTKILSPGSLTSESLLISGYPLSSTGTGGDAYFAMSDYQVLVARNGAVMAVNGGLSSKMASGQVGYVTKANPINWINTNNSMNDQCIHGWKYLNTDGSGIGDGKPITDITKLNDANYWCYRNPFLFYQDSDGTQYKFGATNMQQILWFIGDYQNQIDSIYAFLQSGFLRKAIDLGYDQVATLGMNGELIIANYCMKGDRWVTDGICKNMALNPNTYSPDPSPAVSRLIDFDIKTRICANPTPASQTLCATINPIGLSDVEASLYKLDKNFAYAFASVSATYDYSDAPDNNNITISQDGTYGLSDGSRTKIITDTIKKNAANLSEAHLLYLRKFYVPYTGLHLTNITRYTNNNVLTYMNDYYAMQSVIRTSPNNKFIMIWNSDGNLTIETYSFKVTSKEMIPPTIVWSTATSGNKSAVLSLESSGCLTIYTDHTKTKTLWSTNTSTKNPINLAVDNDGNAVLLSLINSNNNVWLPIWCSKGLSSYDMSLVTVSPIINLLNADNWYIMYKSILKLASIAPRKDLTDNIPLPPTIITYRNAYGTITSYVTNLDTNIIRSFGTPLVPKTDIYAPNDIIWKYILGNFDISFPGMALAPLTVDEFMKTVANHEKSIFTLDTSPYEQQIWTMNGSTVASSGNIIIFRIKSIDAMIKFMRSTGSTLSNDLDFNNLCKISVDACTPEYTAIISANNIDLSSPDYNTICDIANLASGAKQMQAESNYDAVIKFYVTNGKFGANRSAADVIVNKYMTANKISGSAANFSDEQIYAIMTGSSNASGVLGGYSGIFSTANAKAVQATCMSAYGIQKCSVPTVRYKSGFHNKSRFTPRIEDFSGSSCINICNDPNASNEIQSSCKTGSIAYCSQGDNIYGTACSADITKYSELADIKTNWCLNNASHPSYAKYCTKVSTNQPSAQTGSTLTGPTMNDEITQHQNNDSSTIAGMVWWEWLLIAIAIILFVGGIMVVIKRKRNSISTPLSIPSSTQPSGMPAVIVPSTVSASPTVPVAVSAPIVAPMVAPMQPITMAPQ